MKIEDVKLHCRMCNKEIPLSVFQKTGMMGIHDQLKFIDDTCLTCRKVLKEEDLMTGESDGERKVGMDDEITGTPI
jgi:hypothetical protein